MNKETKKFRKYSHSFKLSATAGVIGASAGLAYFVAASDGFRQLPLEKIIAFSTIFITTFSAIVVGADYAVGRLFNLVGDYVSGHTTKRMGNSDGYSQE